MRREEPLQPRSGRASASLKLSNLDKPFWPEEGITKGDLIAYYRDVAPALVPHLRDRPFTMKRYPDGWQGKHFFQKDAPSHMPDWIPTFAYRSTSRATREKRTLRYPLVNDELALLWMANMGCIDMNTWYSRVDKPEPPGLGSLRPRPVAGRRLSGGRPGRAPRSRTCSTRSASPASRRRAAPTASTCSCRSRGGYTYEQTREFAEIVAGTLARLHHGLVTTEWAKAKRRGVLVDANQNGEGKTIASVYSVRPQRGSARLDPASLGRGHRRPRSGRLHDGGRPRPRARATAISTPTCSRRGRRSARRWTRCGASPWRRARACGGSSRCGRWARTRAGRRAASASRRRRRGGRRARARRRAPPRRPGA